MHERWRKAVQTRTRGHFSSALSCSLPPLSLKLWRCLLSCCKWMVRDGFVSVQEGWPLLRGIASSTCTQGIFQMLGPGASWFTSNCKPGQVAFHLAPPLLSSLSSCLLQVRKGAELWMPLGCDRQLGKHPSKEADSWSEWVGDGWERLPLCKISVFCEIAQESAPATPQCQSVSQLAVCTTCSDLPGPYPLSASHSCLSSLISLFIQSSFSGPHVPFWTIPVALALHELSESDPRLTPVLSQARTLTVPLASVAADGSFCSCGSLMVKRLQVPQVESVSFSYQSWTRKKAEHWRTDAFELWCWRRLLKVPWTVRLNQSILKEINSEYSLEGLMLKLKLQ